MVVFKLKFLKYLSIMCWLGVVLISPVKVLAVVNPPPGGGGGTPIDDCPKAGQIRDSSGHCVDAVIVVAGKCNSPPDGSSYCYISSVTSRTLCDRGSASGVSDIGSRFKWTCSTTASTDTCYATDLPTINGSCNSPPDGSSYCYISSVTSRTLCDSGSPSGVSDSGSSFTWSCGGSCGGVTDYCSATDLPNIDGASGNCGDAQDNGGIYTSPPSSSLLCDTGTPSSVTTNISSYTWSCAGLDGQCSGSDGSTVNCSAIRDTAPTYSSLALRTYDGSTLVTAESGSRNQICQSVFKNSSNPTGVRFVVTGADTLQGVGDISTIQVRLRGSSIYTFAAVTAVNGVATIPVDLNASGVATGTYNIEALINDVHGGLNSGWVDTGRDFKYWNCLVPVAGGFYDGSAGVVCPNFTTTLSSEANFRSLTFSSASTGLSSSMTVSGDGSYSGGSNRLTWGTSDYQAVFNEFTTPLLASDLSLRLIDLGIGTTRTCSLTLNFNLNNNVIDPYSNNPSLRADFSATIDQDSWFQTGSGGIMSKSVITDYVSVACKAPTCTPAMSISGLVSAPTLNNNSGVSYSSPNNWHINSDLVSRLNYYEKYKGLGIGETVNGDLNYSNDKAGVVLVGGNIDITQDNTLNKGDFLMLVASGNITIDSAVNNFDGVLVAKNINIAGDSADQLVINGSLYATDQVNITRTYTDKRDNNLSPAVKVNLRPDFIFQLPVEINKKITNWKWGN